MRHSEAITLARRSRSSGEDGDLAIVRHSSAPIRVPQTPQEELQRLERWHAAVRRGAHSAVQAALREGWAPVNAPDSAGFTALMRGCISGQLLTLLLASPRCDVNAAAAADGSTALLLASRYRSASVVDRLLRRGAKMTRERGGATVLHRATANADASVVQLLLREGAAAPARHESTPPRAVLDPSWTL